MLAVWHAVQKWQKAEKPGMFGWKRYCSWTSMEPNKFPNLLSLIQRFAWGSCHFSICHFLLEIESGKLTYGLWIQLHHFVKLDRDFVAKFFL
jgi:hypothetical protein